MDLEKAKKHQSIKVIVSEAIMVLTVAITVIILALVVSGYWLNSNFQVERNGMLQISSVPTGADVSIDDKDSSWIERTNASKILPSGKHTVMVSKEGYDSWSKEINISEGLLYRLHYPRLFLQNRTPEKILDTNGYSYATVSSDRNSLLLINDTTNWLLVDLRNENPKTTKLDIANVISGTSLAEGADVGLFTGKILSADWNYDSNRILFNIMQQDKSEWVLLDIKDPSKSINITKEFSLNFSNIKILDNAANNLLALSDGNMHRIDVSARSVSAVIASQVSYFDHFHNEVVFSATKEDKPYVGYFKIGNEEITELLETESPAMVAISKFYDTKYISILIGKQLSLYEQLDMAKYGEYILTIEPKSLKVGHDGEFLIMNDGRHIASLDMEANKVVEWDIAGDTFGWIDNDMIYSISDGELIVYDYDGFNRRPLAKNVSSHFPAAITLNKWLYYFSDDNLIRELITS